MDYYATTVQRQDGSSHTVDILASSVDDAYTKAMGFYLDAQRILIVVPDQTLHNRIETSVFGSDGDDAA